MNLPGTSQITGRASNLPASKNKSRVATRKKLNETSQAADIIDENLLLVDDSSTYSFIEKESTFKEQLAGNVFQKQLSDHLNRKVGQLFDGIRAEIEKTNRRMALTAPMYDSKQGSFEQKILRTSFFYLSRINHAITTIAYQSDLSYALHEVKRVQEAIDAGFSSSISEISGLGILNNEMGVSFSKAKLGMESGLMGNVSKALIADLEAPLSKNDSQAINELSSTYQLSDSKFIASLLSKYRQEFIGKPAYSESEHIQEAIKTGNISVFNVQPLTGQGIQLYLANENKLPVAEKWFKQSSGRLKQLFVQKNHHVKLIAGVQGELEQIELDALHDLLQKFLNLGNSYFVNRIDRAYSAAIGHGYSGEELAAYVMDEHRKLYRKNIGIYQAVATNLNQRNTEVDLEELVRLEAFIHELCELMCFSEAFGIQGSDRFVIDILDTVISYDDRQNYDFYRSGHTDGPVIEHLVKGIREST